MSWTSSPAADAIVNFPVLIGSVVLVVVAAGLVGWYLGRREASQRMVDAMLRRETRFRHPSARGGEPGVTLPGVSAHDAAEGLSRGAEAVRDAYGVRRPPP